MNRKQFFLLIIVVVVVGGIGLMVNSKRDAGWQAKPAGTGQPLLGNLPVNDITQVLIKQTQAELNLVRVDDTWRVKERGNYPANFNTIRDFLVKASEWKAKQTEAIGPSQYGRMQLLTPDKGANSGTLVEFRDKSGKAVKTIILGKPFVKTQESSPSPFGGEPPAVGRFILDQANPGVVALIGESLSQIEPKPADWLDKEFFRVDKIRAVSVTSTNATNSWALTRETESGDWKLTDAKAGEEFDKNKNAGVAGPLASLSFADVAAADVKPDVSGLDHPTVVKAETFDGFAYTLNIGKLADENYYLTMGVTANIAKERTPGKDEKPEDKEKLEKEFKDKVKQLEEKFTAEKKFEKWTFLVSKWSLDSLLKDRGALMVEKKDEAKKDPAKPE